MARTKQTARMERIRAIVLDPRLGRYHVRGKLIPVYNRDINHAIADFMRIESPAVVNRSVWGSIARVYDQHQVVNHHDADAPENTRNHTAEELMKVLGIRLVPHMQNVPPILLGTVVLEPAVDSEFDALLERVQTIVRDFEIETQIAADLLEDAENKKREEEAGKKETVLLPASGKPDKKLKRKAEVDVEETPAPKRAKTDD